MNRARLVVSLLAAGPLALALLLGSASAFAQQAAPPPPPKKKASKIWTNEDLEQLDARGVNVVGISLKKPEAAAAPAGQASAKTEEKQGENVYAEMSLEERQQWIAKFEQEISDTETALIELRSKALNAASEEERAAANADVERLQSAIEANRAEIELIRNTPLPKPAKPGAQPKPAPAAPSAPSPQ